MATIENLGAAYSSRITLQDMRNDMRLRLKREEREPSINIPTTERAPEIRIPEEAQESREPSAGRGRAIENEVEQEQRKTLEELAEMLRKVNLTFDVFEIRARYIISKTSGDISIEVINQRTGEVIRKIPPYAVPELTKSLLSGEAAVTDVMA